jgi:ammonia channel protein AmtB
VSAATFLRAQTLQEILRRDCGSHHLTLAATWAAGLSGFKSVLSTGVQTMAIASLISICWLMFGYSLAFGPGKDNRFIGGSEKFWFMGSGEGKALLYSCFVSVLVLPLLFVCFPCPRARAQLA